MSSALNQRPSPTWFDRNIGVPYDLKEHFGERYIIEVEIDEREQHYDVKWSRSINKCEVYQPTTVPSCLRITSKLRKVDRTVEEIERLVFRCVYGLHPSKRKSRLPGIFKTLEKCKQALPVL